MYLSDPVKEKITEFVFRYPFPTTNDEDAANWTHKLCEQLKYSFPSDGWGHKKRNSSSPHSADVIAVYKSAPTVVFLGWDIITNAGSPQAKLNLNAESIDLLNPPDGPQYFETVAAQDYLDEEPIPPDPPDDILVSILKELEKHTALLISIDSKS